MPIKHSIIVPNFCRDKHFSVCLASIHHSARVCCVPETDFEIIVVGGTELPIDGFRLIPFRNRPPVELGPNEPMPFHKTAFLNMGLDAASGDVLSFLDADAVVGPLWCENAKRLEDDTLTKLAYRIKYATFTPWEDGRNWLWAFEHYDDLAGCAIAFEGYGTADNDWAERIRKGERPVGPCYGNSHFSIRRDKLGAFRFNEQIWGRGWEDIDANRRIAEKFGDQYRCELVSDGSHACFNIRHAQVPGYEASDWNRRNERLYRNQPKTFYVCPDVEAAERMLAQDPHAEAVTPGNEWRLSRAIPGLDKIVPVEGEET